MNYTDFRCHGSTVSSNPINDKKLCYLMMILFTTVRNARHYIIQLVKKVSSHVNLFKPKLKNEL